MPLTPLNTAVTTVKAAAEKIETSDLVSFLSSNEQRDDKKLMELADFLVRAFSEVDSSFPWVEQFSSVSKNLHTPVSYMTKPVYKKTVGWIKKCNAEAVVSFALWALYSILADYTPALVNHKAFHRPSDKSEVALYAVLGLVLRGKPDVLVDILPTLSECVKYQGQDKLPLVIWIIGQASLNDVTVGLYAWARALLPIVGGTSTCSTESKRLIFLIVGTSNAHTTLENGAVREGERLITPDLFDVLMRVRFPQASGSVEGAQNIRAVYPILKKVALAGEPGSQEMEKVSQKFFSYSIKAMNEGGSSELSKEAIEILGWCLTKHEHCYKQWEKFCDENLEASNAILMKLSVPWELDATKRVLLDRLRKTLLYSKHKNEKAPRAEAFQNSLANFKLALKYFTMLLGGKTLSGHGQMEGTIGLRGMTLDAGMVLSVIWSLFLIILWGIVKSMDWIKLLDIVKSWFWNQLLALDWNKLLETVKSSV